MENKLFTKDFTLVVIGQIISLFGNAVIRFALPLYLLNQTGSSVLFGAVLACANVPMILLSPVGGLVADRVNKRNVMVILDFSTAGLILLFLILMSRVNLVLLLTLTLMVLNGIAGAYQPTVQASIPALTKKEQLMRANALINIISSFSSLSGPVLGGILYSMYGLFPVLVICIVSFVLSAVMELFIMIPYQRREEDGNLLQTARKDMAESIRFIHSDKPILEKGLWVICGINVFLSAMIIVSLPYLITEVLSFPGAQANGLYGYAQGTLAAGGIAGGIGAGILADRLQAAKSGNLLIIASICVFPIGIVLWLSNSNMIIYLTITVCCFVIMLIATVFNVQMISFVQAQTPQNLIGKVMAVMMTGTMCAQPLGNAMYGFLFEFCAGHEEIVIFFAGTVSFAIALKTRKVFLAL